MKIDSILRWGIVAVLAFLLFGLFVACRRNAYEGRVVTPAPKYSEKQSPATKSNANSAIGFRTRRNLEEHYAKHGQEFGTITEDEYLQQAQALRDAPLNNDILEARRSDGVTTRFDRKTRAFLAFNQDLTIRTFFKPNDGERYFKRQIDREH